MKKILAFLMAFWVHAAIADDLKISYLAITNHLTAENQNELHPMIQFEFDRKYVVGGFVNSGDKWSWYIARRWQSNISLKLYIEIGAMSGYISNRLIKSIRYGIELNTNTDLVILPTITDTYKIQNPAAVIGIVFKF